MIQGALFLGERVCAHCHQAALLAHDDAVGLARHIIHVDEGVARCGVDGEIVLQCIVVGGQPAVHGVAVSVEVVYSVQGRCGVRAFAVYGVPA